MAAAQPTAAFCCCGKTMASFKGARGFATHKGKCPFYQHPELHEPAAPPLAAAEEAPAADVEDAQSVHEVDDDGPEAPQPPPEEAALAAEPGPVLDAPPPLFGSETDAAIARLFCQHPGMTVSMLNEVIRISRLGPATARKAKELLDKIDALPGALCVCWLCACVRA